MTDAEKIALLREVPPCPKCVANEYEYAIDGAADLCGACARALFAAVERAVVEAIRARKEPG